MNKNLRLSQVKKLTLYISSLAVISVASACLQPHSLTQVTQPKVTQTPPKKNTVIPPVKPQSLLPNKLHQISHQKIQFNIVTFDTRNQNLIVADQPKGPGSIWPDSQSAAKANKGIAAINAGFFTPEGAPLGIVIANGIQQGSNNTSSLGTAMFYQTNTITKISRRAIWNKLSKSPPLNLLQSGPMLIENSKTVAGLSSKSSRVRSFIATDGKNHWCIGHVGTCTLAQLSNALATINIENFNITTALNLDGGRSSDLWVSSSVTGGPKTIRPFWNKPVRNFLILKSN